MNHYHQPIYGFAPLKRALENHLRGRSRANGGRNEWFDLDVLHQSRREFRRYDREDLLSVVNHAMTERINPMVFENVHTFMVWWDADASLPDGYRYSVRLHNLDPHRHGV